MKSPDKVDHFNASVNRKAKADSTNHQYGPLRVITGPIQHILLETKV